MPFATVMFFITGALWATAGWTDDANDAIFNHIDNPTPELFSVCYDHSCHKIAQVKLHSMQWNHLTALFKPAPLSAHDERSRVATAIAYLETEVGKMIGSSSDKGGNLKGLLVGGKQLDCVDESTNTTTYLNMIQKAGLLKFHRVDKIAHRGFMIVGGWPHRTAVLKSIDSPEQWAIDSWFFDNGMKAAIVPLADWQDGWRPPQ